MKSSGFLKQFFQATGLSIFLAVFLSIFAISAYAELDITISGNGAGSQNTVEVSNEETTVVESTNEVEVNNDVSSDANTGDNEANDNTGGDVSIDTGDVDTTTIVENTINTTTIDASSCCSDVAVDVSNNGAGSQNSVDLSSTSTTIVIVTQEAVVNNTVEQVANTGGNTANRNGGNVAITTGNITGSASIQNGINTTDIDILSGGFADMYLAIYGNGAGSVSDININVQSDVVINKLEQAFIDNFLNSDLDTGNNEASGNLGAVLIGTGNITFMTSIVNDPVNSNDIDINNCCEEEPYDPGTPPGQPPSVGGDGGNGGNGGDGGDGGDSGNGGDGEDGKGGGEVLGAAGEILPATGNALNHLAILGFSLFLLLAGLLLRLKGRKAFAFA